LSVMPKKKISNKPSPLATDTGNINSLLAFTANPSGDPSDAVMKDDRSNTYIFNRPEWFESLTALPESHVLGDCSNSGSGNITHSGTVLLPVKKSDGTFSRIVLKGALFNPQCPYNLVSPGR